MEAFGCGTARAAAALILAAVMLPGALAAGGRSIHRLQAGELILEQGPGGTSISMDGWGTVLQPGLPQLPVRRFTFLLPPGARAVSAEVTEASGQAMSGSWSFPSAQPPVPLLPPDLLAEELDRLHGLWQMERRRQLSSELPVPETPAGLVASGTLGPYAYATVAFCPFSHQPSTGELVFFPQVTVAIDYVLPEAASPEQRRVERPMVPDRFARLARDIFCNWPEASAMYRRPPDDDGPRDSYDYVIVTAEELEGALDASGFVAWKTALGFGVRTVLLSDPEIADQPGADLAEQVRNFLRDYYLNWGIEYVLLVGDYETVPMRICYPNPDYHVYDPSDPGLVAPGTPTDCYYADLSYPDSVSWDADGDGYLGEYGDDQPDFMPEVYVGRIPVNDPSRITYALDKTVAFEGDDGSWKTNVLHPTSILFFENQYHGGGPFIDGATAIDSIETGLMGGCDIDHMSEQFGVVKSPFPWPPISETAVSNHWSNGQYGVVNWSGHGWTNGAGRTVWAWDDGDGVPESGELQSIIFIDVGSTELEEDYPSVVFAISCDVGFPEPAPLGNCGIDLLTRPGWGASIGVISASRPAAVSSDWKESPGGAEQICYDFNRHLIALGEPVGMAAHMGKYDATSVYGWDFYYEYVNFYDYNLYGDPALELEGFPTEIEQDQPQSLPVLSVGRPNPFRRETEMVLALPHDGRVEAAVYDAAGRRVAELVRGNMAAGEHLISWGGTDESGAPLAPGVYFALVSADGHRMTRKLVLLR